jgi:membrane protein DedA with SNARE-associated domain
MTDSIPSDDGDILALSSLIKRLFWGLGLLVVLSFMAGLTLQEPITSASDWFVRYFGLWGVFFGVLFLDTLPLTFAEPLILLAIEGGEGGDKLGFWTVTTVAATGSWLSALIGYSAGLLLARTDWLTRVFRRYRMDRFMARYGTAFVAVAAITPFPYGISTVCAGASRLPLARVMTAALLRFPKNYFYMALVLAGWTAGT